MVSAFPLHLVIKCSYFKWKIYLYLYVCVFCLHLYMYMKSLPLPRLRQLSAHPHVSECAVFETGFVCMDMAALFVASASKILGLKVCTIMHGMCVHTHKHNFLLEVALCNPGYRSGWSVHSWFFCFSSDEVLEMCQFALLEIALIL